jgi:hypothetical protein
MSGYNYSNWGRRGRDCGSNVGGGDQNSGYWNTGYNRYENFNQYHYPKLTYPQKWNSVCWNKPDKYSGTYGREHVAHNKSASRHPYNPSQGYSKTTGHSSSVKVKTSHSVLGDRDRDRDRKQKRHSSSSRNRSSSQRKVISPPLGSEEARKKTLAQATDKIKSCLLSFQNEKSEVLENLLSNKEQEVAELEKANPVKLEKSDYAELRLTPSDLKVIGMVTTSGTGASLEMDETGNCAVETISTNEFIGSSSTAEIAASSSRDVFCTFSTLNTELLDNVERVNICSSLERDDQSRYAPENNYQGKRGIAEDQVAHSDLCAQSRSASLGISDAAGDSNQPKDGTNENTSSECLFLNKQNEPKETLKNLKQRIIQEFLKMGKNNLKDLINNPRSRKFEFAMNHLMKEHRLLLSRELRGLAQSRIRGQDVENQGHSEPVCEASSLLNTDIEINLSHLPQEVIEQLGSLLQLDLLDNAESIDFQPITVDNEESVHDLQNIQALQVALLSEEYMKKEDESEIKPFVRREASGNSVNESGGERNLVEGQHGSDCQLNRSVMDAGIGQTEDVLRREMECERDLILEESAAAKKPRKESGKWPNYIPLGKGFMNRSGEFGNMFVEFPDLMDMGSPESEAVGGNTINMTGNSCTRQTIGEMDTHLKLQTDKHPGRTSDIVLNSDVPSKASEAHIRPTHEMTDCSSSWKVCDMPSGILNNEVDVNFNKSLSNISTEHSGIKSSATNCSSSCDKVESCSDEKWVDTSKQEGFDSLHNTTVDTGNNIPASHVPTDVQAKDMLEGCRDTVEPSEGSAVTDGRVKYFYEPFTDNDEPLQGAAATDKPIEGSSKPTDALFADEIDNNNALVSGVTEGMTLAADGTGLGESEIKAEDLRLSKENHVTSVTDTTNVPSARLNSDSVFVRKHVENLETNLYTSESDRNLNMQMNRNEESTCSVEDETLNKETERNENESVGSEISSVGDVLSKTMGTRFVLSGNNAANTNFNEDIISDRKGIWSATAEQNMHSNDTAESIKSGFSNEAEITPSRGIHGSVIVDDLPSVLCDTSVAEDNSSVGKTQVGNSADSGIKVVTHIPVSEEAEKMGGNGLSIVKSHVPNEDGCTENPSLVPDVSVQFELPSSNAASNCETHDDMEICHNNVVVKTEKIDDAAMDETSPVKVQAQHEVNNGKLFCIIFLLKHIALLNNDCYES